MRLPLVSRRLYEAQLGAVLRQRDQAIAERNTAQRSSRRLARALVKSGDRVRQLEAAIRDARAHDAVERLDGVEHIYEPGEYLIRGIEEASRG